MKTVNLMQAHKFTKNQSNENSLNNTKKQWLVMAVLSHHKAVFDVIGSEEGIDAFIYGKSEGLVR